jgi:hypothetical protein
LSLEAAACDFVPAGGRRNPASNRENSDRLVWMSFATVHLPCQHSQASSRCAEVTINDDVALRGQRRIKTKFWHWAWLPAVDADASRLCAGSILGPAVYSPAGEPSPTTLYAARGRLIPFNSNSPTGSTVTAFSTFVSTRGLIKICPGFASSQAERQHWTPSRWPHNRTGPRSRWCLVSQIRRASSPIHSGHCRSTRVRCRMVNLIRGRCLTAAANVSRALSRLLPA